MLNSLISVRCTSRETIYCIGKSGIVIYAPSRTRHSLTAHVADGGPGKEDSCWHSGGENMPMICPCGCSLSWVSNCRSDTDRWHSFWSLVCERLKKYEDLNQIAWKCSTAFLNFLVGSPPPPPLHLACWVSLWPNTEFLCLQVSALPLLLVLSVVVLVVIYSHDTSLGLVKYSTCPYKPCFTRMLFRVLGFKGRITC